MMNHFSSNNEVDDGYIIKKVSQNYHNKSWSSHGMFSQELELDWFGNSNNADSDNCDISDICLYPHRRSSFNISPS